MAKYEFTLETANRLLDVARALREVPVEHQERFTMEIYTWGEPSPERPRQNWCGSPACALGHYAAREDLQNVCYIQTGVNVVAARGNSLVNFAASELPLSWFGLNRGELAKLFSGSGCNNAQSPIEAALYIENFVLDRAKAVFIDLELALRYLAPGRDGLHAVLRDYSRINARVQDHASIKPLKLKLKQPRRRAAAKANAPKKTGLSRKRSA